MLQEQSLKDKIQIQYMREKFHTLEKKFDKFLSKGLDLNLTKSNTIGAHAESEMAS